MLHCHVSKKHFTEFFELLPIGLNTAKWGAGVSGTTKYVTLCTIWCHLYNFKNKQPWRSVTFSSTKSNRPPWILFCFF